MRNTVLLWIQLILRSARILSLNTARKPLNRSTTALLLLVMILKLFLMDTANTTSVKLRLKLSPDMDKTTTTTFSASASPINSVTRNQSRTSAKSVMRNMTSSLTPLILRNAKTSSPPIVKKLLNRFTTALLLLVMTPRLCPTDILDTDMASVMLRLKPSLDIPVDLSAVTRRTDSATRSQSRMSARFPALSAKPLLILPTLRSVKKPSPLSATLLPPRSTIALLLLVTTPRLLLTVMVDMVDTRSVKQTPKLNQDTDTPVDPNAMPRRTDSATRSLSRTPTRFPDKSVSP